MVSIMDERYLPDLPGLRVFLVLGNAVELLLIVLKIVFWKSAFDYWKLLDLFVWKRNWEVWLELCFGKVARFWVGSFVKWICHNFTEDIDIRVIQVIGHRNHRSIWDTPPKAPTAHLRKKWNEVFLRYSFLVKNVRIFF